MKESMQGKTALVLGASSGIGAATVKALVAAGAAVTGVARRRDKLDALEAELRGRVATTVADVFVEGALPPLLRATRPDLVVLAAGIPQGVAPLDSLTWEAFSEAWNGDTKAAFLLVKSVLTVPLAPGSTVILVSSGAAIHGSPLSGGYAGAKRMQWLLANYAQGLSDEKHLGIRFRVVLPKQLILGTKIGDGASAAYGAKLGISGPDFMKRFATQLTVEKVASAIVHIAARADAAERTAVAVTGEGLDFLA